MHGGCRRVDVQKRHVRLAILADAVGEGLHAPVFFLLDRTLTGLDHTLVLGDHFFDLLRGHVLTREKNMLVKRHG